jgi:hypothetical protein
MILQSSPRLNIRASSIFGHLGDPSKFISASVLGTVLAEDIFFVNIEILLPIIIGKTKLLQGSDL